MKKLCSKEKILPQNIKWSKNVKAKGNDTIPEHKASLGRKGKGPLSKNFDIPAAAENMLSRKVTAGKRSILVE